MPIHLVKYILTIPSHIVIEVSAALTQTVITPVPVAVAVTATAINVHKAHQALERVTVPRVVVKVVNPTKIVPPARFAFPDPL